MQGKTTEIQSLDTQSTFADVLEKSTRVQFNIHAKQRLAKAGAKVRQSSNRRQRAFAFSFLGYEVYARRADNWEVPYHYDHPAGLQFMDGGLPED